MDVLNRLSGFPDPLFEKPNPAAQRLARTGHPGNAFGRRDQGDFGGPDGPRALGLVKQNLLGRLERLLSVVEGPATVLPEDFRPEAVADQVLGFVRAGLAGVEDPVQRAELLEQAAGAVEQGVAEAREVLSDAGLLDELELALGQPSSFFL